MKRFALVLLAALLLAWAGPALAEVKVNLGVVTTPGMPHNIAAEKLRDLVEERSKKDILIRIHHSASLGSETEILQQIQMGSVQMGVITTGPFDTFNPITRVIDYPFLFKDNAQVDKVLDGPLGQSIIKELEAQGFKGLAYTENGWRNMTITKKPIKTADDCKGLKIRVMESVLHKAIWQAIGANPTPMPWPIYTELEQGVIDAQENPLVVIEQAKLYEIQKHLTLTRHTYSPHILVASLKWWNTLKPEQQEILAKAGYEAAVYERKWNRDKDAGRIKFLKEKGMQVVEDPDVASFRAKVVNIKDLDLFKEPKVKDMLAKFMEATK